MITADQLEESFFSNREQREDEVSYLVLKGPWSTLKHFLDLARSENIYCAVPKNKNSIPSMSSFFSKKPESPPEPQRKRKYVNRPHVCEALILQALGENSNQTDDELGDYLVTHGKSKSSANTAINALLKSGRIHLTTYGKIGVRRWSKK